MSKLEKIFWKIKFKTRSAFYYPALVETNLIRMLWLKSWKVICCQWMRCQVRIEQSGTERRMIRARFITNFSKMPSKTWHSDRARCCTKFQLQAALATKMVIRRCSQLYKVNAKGSDSGFKNSKMKIHNKFKIYRNIGYDILAPAV